MKKIILTILICGAMVLGMAGCTEQKEKENDVQEKSKGNCEAEECIKLIEPEMKLEEMNNIIGFEGEKKGDSDTYIWQLTPKTKIEVEYKNDSAAIKATMDKNKLNNKDLNASIFYAIQNDIRSGITYTYEEMVEKFEGIEGYLENKSSTSKMYMWVKDGQTFRATFSDSLDGRCSIVSLR